MKRRAASFVGPVLKVRQIGSVHHVAAVLLEGGPDALRHRGIDAARRHGCYRLARCAAIANAFAARRMLLPATVEAITFWASVAMVMPTA